MALKTEKTAVLAPIPRASDNTATVEMTGAAPTARSARRRSPRIASNGVIGTTQPAREKRESIDQNEERQGMQIAVERHWREQQVRHDEAGAEETAEKRLRSIVGAPMDDDVGQRQWQQQH